MVRFYPPTTDANIDKSKFKRWIYTPFRNGIDVYAPFDGKVYGIDKNKGLIKIKHFFSKDTYTTKFYELGEIFKSNGEFVKKGELIGKTTTQPFSMEIVDSGNLEQLISPFFTGSVNLGVETNQKLEPTRKEQPPKENITPQEKDKPLKGQYNLQTIEKNGKKKVAPAADLETYDPGELSLMDLGLIPFHLLGLAGTFLRNKMKRKKTKKEDLKEEVDRIKQLLK